MFYVFALGSMLAYALQQTLLVHYARRMDGLSLAFYRNISFIVTLLPLLLFAPAKDIVQTLQHWPLLLFMAVSGGISLWLMFAAYQFLSVSYSGAISAAVATVTTTTLGWIILSERLTPVGMLLIAVVVAGILLFGFHYKHLPHLDGRMALGILMTATGGMFNAGSKLGVAILSRESNPLVSGYFWEASIGLACAVLILLRFLGTGQRIKRIDRKTFLIIAACGSPTLVGTGLFTLATSHGPLAIVSAVGTAGLVVGAFLAFTWYGEKMDRKQMTGMAIVLAGIIGLKFV